MDSHVWSSTFLEQRKDHTRRVVLCVLGGGWRVEGTHNHHTVPVPVPGARPLLGCQQTKQGHDTVHYSTVQCHTTNSTQTKESSRTASVSTHLNQSETWIHSMGKEIHWYVGRGPTSVRTVVYFATRTRTSIHPRRQQQTKRAWHAVTSRIRPSWISMIMVMAMASTHLHTFD
jgi:hypothetical protein